MKQTYPFFWHFNFRGQLCDYCDETSRSQSHPPEQAVDGTEKWWQSPPLSRGLSYNEVNLTIDLAQVRDVLILNNFYDYL